MSEVSSPGWRPDPVTRLLALAAALPGAVVARRIVESPFAQVWAVLADMERSVPIYESQVERLRVLYRASGELDVDVELVGGRHQAMQARLTEGWCLMQSRDVVVGMAAKPVGARTLVAHLEHVRRDDGGPAAGRAIDAAEQQAKLLAEIAVVEQLARGPAAGPNGTSRGGGAAAPARPGWW